MTNFYLALGISALSFYSMASYLGWELGTPGRETAQAAHGRHTTHGARSHWFIGSRGGK